MTSQSLITLVGILSQNLSLKLHRRIIFEKLEVFGPSFFIFFFRIVLNVHLILG